MSTSTLANPTEQFRATIERSIEIDASPEIIFDAILDDMRSIADADGKAMKFQIEPYPGGRWYRDLGNNAGHLWGHVQVIKPPKLLEVWGPLMISSACISHVTYRVSTDANVNTLKITHKLFGDFDAKIPNAVGGGWQQVIDRIKAKAVAKAR